MHPLLLVVGLNKPYMAQKTGLLCWVSVQELKLLLPDATYFDIR